MSNRRVIFLTGAGISAPSGLATFRHDPKGFWTQNNPDEVCHAATRHTNAHYAFTNKYRQLVSECIPNHAHCWIASIQRNLGTRVSLYTTNIDDLHEMAGSVVTHLHGCVNRIRCEECGVRVRVGLKYNLYGGELCTVGCKLGAMMRNDVVLFDEDIDTWYRPLLRDLQDAGDHCVFVIIGASLDLYSFDTVQTRATKVFVNVDPTSCEFYSSMFDFVVCGDVSKRETLERVEEILSPYLE